MPARGARPRRPSGAPLYEDEGPPAPRGGPLPGTGQGAGDFRPAAFSKASQCGAWGLSGSRDPLRRPVRASVRFLGVCGGGEMRILVLEDELSPRGGQELSLVSVCEALSRRGHEIILLYKSGGSLEARYRAFCSRLIRAGAYSIDHRNFSGSVAGFFGALARSCAARPGLIYANQYQDSLLAGCVSFFCGAPFVCHLRIPSPKRFCNQHRLGLSMVNRLIVISKNMRSDWERHAFLRGRLELVYNGIDAG